MLPELKTNADGSLTLFIQKDDDRSGRRANWLPAPDGPIYVVAPLLAEGRGADRRLTPPGIVAAN